MDGARSKPKFRKSRVALDLPFDREGVFFELLASNRVSGQGLARPVGGALGSEGFEKISPFRIESL